jgi:cytosine/adenosine deaminase-related metal-dependent hydrolase
MAPYDIVINNATVDDSDNVVDIGISNGEIRSISESINAESEKSIDIGGNFVSPGFVDCHTHLDRVYAACGSRKPKSGPGEMSQDGFAEYLNVAFDEYHKEAPMIDIEENAIKDIQRAVSNGTTHIRSHVAVDHPTTTENIRALLRAKDRTTDLVDLQLVPMSSKGILNDASTERKLREAIEIALEEDPSGNSVLVGGADPASRNNDIERTIDTWFDIATDYDIDIDVHIQDGGLLGEYTLKRLIEKTDEHGYNDRVTASHSFSLAHLPDYRLEELISRIREVGLKLVTCYNSTRCGMPIKTLINGGITLGHGTDNHRDFIIPHGDSDTLAAVLTEINKLHGDRFYDEEYRWYETNDGIQLLWNMVTRGGSEVMGINGEYGICEGADADLVVFDAPSPQWAVIDQAERSYVIKNGTVIGESGELLPEAVILEQDEGSPESGC